MNCLMKGLLQNSHTIKLITQDPVWGVWQKCIYRMVGQTKDCTFKHDAF